ncbi:pentatricopeptide repeat-containing protein At5g43790 [Phoenix dactylifera]|uniref:Pentatricopeptide repeat-containing protein At5g43790 n=1 Tax=Phoenix dactylifera TaxID=42345 RepID=A0A8B8J5Q1_PHODC|nr:pentatricopeptide repeat-containing protein At5g43790 [Phoenix dactylifera]XP_026661173.2 pentatricopeptide repeat-containing protein At5g43790 [Phoenix dactylifera]XP_026661174.2 pentatricopeptide repeat-containing protein At5g43790 [Phoenix dactylifera]
MKRSQPICHHPILLLLLEAKTQTPATFKQIHARFITSGLALHTYPLSRLLVAASLPPLSSALGLSHAAAILRRATRPSVFLANTLLSSLAAHGHTHLALSLYSELLLRRPDTPKPNNHTYPSLLKACSHPPWHPHGLALHAHLIKCLGGAAVDPFVRAALLSFYSKCGKLAICRQLFDQISQPDLPTWNCILAAYARCPSDAESNGSGMETLFLFQRLQLSSNRPNEISLVALISACGDLGALSQGLWAHAYVERNDLVVNFFVATALIDMYSKCGRLDLAEQVFAGLPEKDTHCYNAMIRGLAIHGHGRHVIGLFDKMRSEGVAVDDVTLVVMMSACAHAGLVDEGRRCFDRMQMDFGIVPKIEHYGCLLDLLGRAGQLEEAEEVMWRMPMKPNAVMYRTLLVACRIHNKSEMGERMIENLMQLEPEHGGNYVLLSNMYADADRWDDVRRVRKVMKDKGIDKNPGSSLVEIDGAMHEFLMGDKTHPHSKEIYSMLDEMDKKLHECGHRPSTKEVLFDVEEEDKEDALSYHSERLAIAFSLLASGSSAPIRVIKNLRVCGDCHSATKLISWIYRREIIMRDRNRFHHFKDDSIMCNLGGL